jgi:hypothetical protein
MATNYMGKLLAAALIILPIAGLAATVTTTNFGQNGNIPSDSVPGVNYINQTASGSSVQAPRSPSALDQLMSSGGPPAPKKTTDRNQQGGALDNLLNVGGRSGAGSEEEQVAALPMEREDVEEIMRVDSINAYKGECPCPYSFNRDGFECGVESAYYKPGGYRIYCYPRQDIRKQQEIFYRKNH